MGCEGRLQFISGLFDLLALRQVFELSKLLFSHMQNKITVILTEVLL